MKRDVLAILAVVGAICVCAFALRLMYAATDNQGFWWGYSCASQPVTFTEVDANRNGHIEFGEANLTCDTMPLKRSINGKVCIEYLEPKAGVPLQTVCRDDAMSLPQDVVPG